MRAPAVSLALSVLLVAACGAPEPVDVPTVVGYRLSDSYDVLEEAGFGDVEHNDELEDRAVFDRDNWVVVAQSPSAGTTHSPREQVDLGVMKLDDPGVAQRLPADAAVMEEVRSHEETRQRQEAEDLAREAARAAEEEDRRQEEAKAAQSELVSYVEELDPAMLLAKQMIEGMDEFADMVATGQLNDADFRLGADTVNATMSQMVDSMAGVAPSERTGRRGYYEALQEAGEGFSRAAATLLSASGSTREQSLARYEEIWAQAVADWNAALEGLYEGTGISPPTVTE